MPATTERKPRRRLTAEERATLPLRAFKVGAGAHGEEDQEVVFAQTAGQAKQYAAFSPNYDFTEMSAVRAPEFDGCACVDGDRAKGPTAREYLERDWWVPCHGCDRQVWDVEEAGEFSGGGLCAWCVACAERRRQEREHSEAVKAAAYAAAAEGRVL